MSEAFRVTGATVALTAASTTSNASVGFPTLKGAKTVRIKVAAGGQEIFWKSGSSTVEAATTDTPMDPGTVEVFTIPAHHTHIAVIAASGTTAVKVTPGEGA